jgi:hypothetical protein
MRNMALIATAAIFAISAPAMAWKAYHLEGNQYAILCTDGAIFTYSGSGSGLSISGDALCEGHGGIAGGGGNGPTAQRGTDLQDIGVRKRPGRTTYGRAQPQTGGTTGPSTARKKMEKLPLAEAEPLELMDETDPCPTMNDC